MERNSYTRKARYEAEELGVKAIRREKVQLALAMLANKPRSSGDWQDSALCSVVDPEIFDEQNHATEDAVAICNACDVKDRCLEYALENNIKELIWGGLKEDERKSLKRRGARERYR